MWCSVVWYGMVCVRVCVCVSDVRQLSFSLPLSQHSQNIKYFGGEINSFISMLDCLVPLGVMMVSVKEGCRCDKRFLILNLGDFPCNISTKNTFCYEHSKLSVRWWKAHFLEPTKFRLFDVRKLMLPDIKIMAQVLCIFWIIYQRCCCFVQPVSVVQCTFSVR